MGTFVQLIFPPIFHLLFHMTFTKHFCTNVYLYLLSYICTLTTRTAQQCNSNHIVFAKAFKCAHIHIHMHKNIINKTLEANKKRVAL